MPKDTCAAVPNAFCTTACATVPLSGEMTVAGTVNGASGRFSVRPRKVTLLGPFTRIRPGTKALASSPGTSCAVPLPPSMVRPMLVGPIVSVEGSW